MELPRLLFRIGEEGTDAALMALRQKQRAEQQKSAPVQPKIAALTVKIPGYVPGLIGGALGARKAYNANEDELGGAVRGGLGATAGAVSGVVAGAYAGIPLTGGYLGALAGYKLLTEKYENKHAHSASDFGADSALAALGLDKEAGLLNLAQTVRSTLTAPIPGTKPWLLTADKQITRNAAPALRKPGLPAPSTKWSGGNVYDVSEQARRMGL